MTNLLRVRTVFTYGLGSPGLMTNYFARQNTIYADADAQNAVNRVRDMMLTSPTAFPAAFRWDVSGEVDIVQDTDGVVQGRFGVIAAGGNGTSNNPLGPLTVGVLLQHKTGAFVGGRRLVGRTFFVPVANNVVNAATVSTAQGAFFQAMGEALGNAGITDLFPYIWSRPRAATAVGPGRPAGVARQARLGSSARTISWSCSSKYVVLTSRRD